MDSLTQIALGIATADLAAGNKLGRRSYIYGAVLGTLPDLDVVAGMFLPAADGVALHRGLSHSLLFMIVVSPIIGWLIAKIERGKISWRHSALLVLCCLGTHVMLDLFTSWGTQVFWPYPTRISLKTIFVVDPLYTVPLLISLVMALRKKVFASRKKYILKGIYISTAYLALTCGIKLYTLNKFEDALKVQHISHKDIIVKPTAFNCILWNANVDTGNAYLLADYSLFDTQPVSFKAYPKNNHFAAKLEGNRDFETLKQASEGWYIITYENGNLYFNDLRFGLLTDTTVNPQFAFSYVFEEQNGELRAEETPKKRKDGLLLLRKIAKRIAGN